ncbi:hypothetical protein [Lysinibacillus sphaericus]|uniref:hypothetical protein n=1 Tax=Lysinibacillus sphaericus TaxID=1421 RepID=UPI00055FFE1F|nr:hypothetical protein [Lysinibacillus sphaericus]
MELTAEQQLAIIKDASLLAMNSLPPNFFRANGGHKDRMRELESLKFQLNGVVDPELTKLSSDVKESIELVVKYLRTNKEKFRKQALRQSDDVFAEIIKVSECIGGRLIWP